MNKKSAMFSLESIDSEPWVKIPNAKDLEQLSPEENILFNQTLRAREKYLFYMQTFDLLASNNVIGDYFEFGSHRCRTFRMALTEAKRRSLDFMHFYSFDSYQGLPEPTTDHDVTAYKKGALATSEENFLEMVKNHGIYLDQVKTFKGYYDQSLTPTLQKELLKTGRKIAFLCVDCDLYESAVPVFNFIEPFLQEGTVVFIDDFFAGYHGSPAKGVPKAFAEFQERTKFRFIEHFQVGWAGRSFITY